MELQSTIIENTSFSFEGDYYRAHRLYYDDVDDLIGDYKILNPGALDLVDVDYSNGQWSALYSPIPGATVFVGGYSPEAYQKYSKSVLYDGYVYGVDYGVGQDNIGGVDYNLYFGIQYQRPSNPADDHFWALDTARTTGNLQM